MQSRLRQAVRITSPRRLICGLALLAALVAPLAAWAGTSADVTATGTLSAGSLALATSATPSFAVSLDGTDKTPTYAVPMTITDPRGTGAGWNITLTSTHFDTGSATLSNTASAVTSAISACNGGNTCTNATNAIGYPLTVPAGVAPPAAVKIFNAGVNTGLGKLDVTPTVTVSVPGNALAGVYTSTLTVAVVSGP